MSYWEAVLFGLVQGLTEFLPISSTAHLIFTEKLLGHSFPGLAFEIYLHLASVLAVIVFYRNDILQLIRHSVSWLMHRRDEDLPHFRFALMIVIATVITGVIGVSVKDWLDDSIKSLTVMGCSLIVTGIFLFIIERIRSGEGRGMAAMRWSDSLWVGLGQAVAVIPGISRSGSTLVAALWVGLERETAVRYSFLLAIPVIAGSSVIGLKDATSGDFGLSAGVLAVSFVVSFFASLAGIIWLLNFVRKQRLTWFAAYCLVVGTIAVIVGN